MTGDPGRVVGPRPLEPLVRRVEPLAEDDTLAAAAARVADAGGGLPVAGPDGRLVGYLSERDLLDAVVPAYLRVLPRTGFLTRDFASLAEWARRGSAETVGRHMGRDPVFVDADDSESHAAELFLHHGLRSLPVVDPEGRVLGVLRLGDLVQSLLDLCRDR